MIVKKGTMWRTNIFVSVEGFQNFQGNLYTFLNWTIFFIVNRKNLINSKQKKKKVLSHTGPKLNWLRKYLTMIRLGDQDHLLATIYKHE